MSSIYDSGANVIFTVGEPGAGKTFVRCAKFLYDWYLPRKKGVHYSNFPVNSEILAGAVAKKLSRKRSLLRRLFGRKYEQKTAEKLLRRIQIIPPEVLRSWRNEESGPWEFFSDVNLKHCHIAVDEIHEYINNRCTKEYIKLWGDWIATIRHNGAVLECITQDKTQVVTEVKSRAGIQYVLEPLESEKDPFLGIMMKDWYELQAKISGQYKKAVVLQQLKRSVKHNGNTEWKKLHKQIFRIDDFYFPFYNSYNNTQGETKEDTRPEYEYENRTFISLVFWFLGKNFFRITCRLVIVTLFCWLFFGGGFQFGINYFLNFMRMGARANSKTVKKSPVNTVNIAGKTAKKEKALTELQKKQIQLEKLQRELVLKEQEIKKLKDIRENYKIVFINKEYAILTNNLRIHTAYEFKAGSLKGRKVVNIDYENRRVFLDDSTVLNI